MRNLLRLPSALLVLLAVSSWATTYAERIVDGQTLQDGQDLDARDVERAWTGDKAVLRRNVEVERRMSSQAPVAVKKMSTDPGEKFWPEYWGFDFDEETMVGNNASMELPFLPPLLPHTSSCANTGGFLDGLFRRQTTYQCQSGYTSCAGIGYTNNCCASGYTCTIVPNNSSGPVGCCLNGQNCVGPVSSCNTAAGYTYCNNTTNGGCCAPGAICDSVGCIYASTTTVTGAYATSTTTSISTSTSTFSTSQVNSVATVTVTAVVYSSIPSSISTVLVTSYVPTDTTYNSGSTTTTTTTITSGSVASISSSSISGSTTSTSLIQGYCPGGFYQCSAWYDGGCCQVGRDCAKTNCPQTVITEVVNGGVVTILVVMGSGVTTISPTGQSTTTTTASSIGAVVTSTVSTLTSTTTTISGSSTSTTTNSAVIIAGGGCATGWFSCDAAAGGGCCPTGYSCAASCIATQSGEPGHVYKVPPSGAASLVLGLWLHILFASVTSLLGIGMVVL